MRGCLAWFRLLRAAALVAASLAFGSLPKSEPGHAVRPRELADVEHTSHHGNGTASVPCVLQFDDFISGRARRAGIGDITTRLHSMMKFSLAFGCAMMPPRPADGLTPDHNHGKPIDRKVWWTRYHAVGGELNLSSGWELLWESVPAGRKVHTTTVVDHVPSADSIARLRADSARHGRLELLKISMPSRYAYGASGTVEELNRARQTSPFPKDLNASNCLPWPASSAEVLERADTIAGILFNRTPFFHFHLRRGDRLQHYTDPHCMDVPAVLAAVLEQRVSQCAHLNAIFVATDEKEVGYLSRLRADLGAFFQTVRIEAQDIPARLRAEDDNYFDYMVAKHVHPRETIAGCDWTGISMDPRTREKCSRVERPFTMPPPSPTLPFPLLPPAPSMQPTPPVPPSLHILETPPSLPPPPPTLTPRTATHQIVMRPSRKAAIAAAAIVLIALLMWGGRFLSGWLLGQKRGYSTVSTQVGHLPPHRTEETTEAAVMAMGSVAARAEETTATATAAVGSATEGSVAAATVWEAVATAKVAVGSATEALVAAATERAVVGSASERLVMGATAAGQEAATERAVVGLVAAALVAEATAGPANVGLGGGAAAVWMDLGLTRRTSGLEAAALESSCSVGGSSDATGQSPGLATPSAEPSDSASVMHNELSTQLSPLTGDRAPPTTATGTGTVAGAGAQAGTLSEENEADEIYHL